MKSKTIRCAQAKRDLASAKVHKNNAKEKSLAKKAWRKAMRASAKEKEDYQKSWGESSKILLIWECHFSHLITYRNPAYFY